MKRREERHRTMGRFDQKVALVTGLDNGEMMRHTSDL
jgi:hypothetical protein